MTQKKHDQYAKQLLAELLNSKGQVHINYEIPGEPRYADLYFVPTTTKTMPIYNLGLLGKMASAPCLIEPFRNQPTKSEIRYCMQKLFALQGRLQNEAKRKDKISLTEAALPHLWILATSASETLLNSFGAKQHPQWEKGIYFCNDGFKTSIISINQLPTTPETLLIRLLGKGTTQTQAINEVLAFDEKHALRQFLGELLLTWRINLEVQDRLTEDDKELLMNLSPIYEKWRELTLQEGMLEGMLEGMQKGMQQGRSEMQRVFLENMLISKFGSIDEPLMQITNPLLQLTPEEMTRLLMQCSREELLAKFSHESKPNTKLIH
jgi:hypothetical protein